MIQQYIDVKSASSRLREYELRDLLEGIQDATIEELTAAMPPQGDSTNTPTDGTIQAGTVRDRDLDTDYDVLSTSQQRGTSTHQGSDRGRNTSPASTLDNDDDEPDLQRYDNHMDRERSMTIGAT